jgi:DNA-binding CsgD family transcriptional regulator
MNSATAIAKPAITPAPAAVSPPVWLLAGQIIIDRDPRPAMIVDAAGRIRAANRPLVEHRARASSELLGRKWVDAWPFDSNGARAAAEAMARAHQGEVAHVTLGAPTPQGDTAISLFELTAVGIDAALIVSILATKLAGKTEGVQPASGLHYEIEAEAPWRLRHVWSAEARPLRTEGPCYETLHGRTQPCEGCPALRLDDSPNAEAQSILPNPVRRLRLDVVNARRIPGGAISVSAWAVDDSLLSALIAAKVDALAKMSGLSGRERSVLDLLLLGRSHAEIGTVLDISARTAKYHQARIQAKLGVDSRVDLLRVIL